MGLDIFQIKLGLNSCYLIRGKTVIMIDGGMPNKINTFKKNPFRLRPGLPIYALDIATVKENWKLLIDKGAKMIYPGHGNPFPVEVMKKILN